MKGFLVFLFLLMVSLGSAYAADEVRVKEVVITATKTEALIEDVPATITVITKEEIKAKGAEKLRDIFELDPGLTLTRARARDFPSIRGFGSQHVLILIDGRRLAGEVEQDFELDRITLENVERIEILKGPASALYGTDALGGVINIITRTPDEFVLELTPRFGTYSGGGERQTLSVYTGGKLGRFGITLSGQFLNARPYFREDQTTLLEERQQKTLGLKLSYDLTKHTQVIFDGSFMEEDVESRSFFRVPILIERLRRDINYNERYDLSVALSHKSPDLEYFIRGYLSKYDKDYEHRILATNRLAGFDTARVSKYIAEGRITKEVLKGHLATLGAEYRQESFRGTRLQTGKDPFTEIREGITRTGSTAEIDYWAIYVQDEWQVADKLLIIPALRYDDSNRFPGNLSPKLGITYKILPNLRVKANYAHGFKTPSPRDLYIEFRHPGARYVILGNPALGPEKTVSYEAALEGETGILSGRIAYFFNDVQDLIETVEVVPPPPGTPAGWRVFTYQNIAKAKIQGIEAAAGISLTEELSLKVGYAYLDAKDEVRKQRLLMRPKHKLTPRLSYNNKPLGLRASIWGEWIGDNLWRRAAVIRGVTMPEIIKDYALWHVNLSKDISKHIEIYAGVDNLFNKKDNDIPIIGSFYYGGMRMKF
jgi:outer membrane receptor for ferrienterochelin and colicins